MLRRWTIVPAQRYFCPETPMSSGLTHSFAATSAPVPVSASPVVKARSRMNVESLMRPRVASVTGADASGISDSVQAACRYPSGPIPPNSGPSGKSPRPASIPSPVQVCFCGNHSNVATVPR